MRGNPFHLLLILLYLCPPLPSPSRAPISLWPVASSGGGGFLEPFCVSCLAPSRFSQSDCAPLHEAAFHGHVDVLKVLLVAGANAHALEKVSKRREKDTGTPPRLTPTVILSFDISMCCACRPCRSCLHSEQAHPTSRGGSRWACQSGEGSTGGRRERPRHGHG